MRRALVVLPLFLLLSACGSSHVSTAPAISSHAAIWFHPKPTVPSDPLNGSSDFLSLFQTTPTWPIALAHTQVIGLYAGWVANIDDATLQQLVTFLNAHNLTIELESPSLQALSTCGSGVEGYVPYGLSIQAFTASYLGRLTALGAHVAYVKIDEPFYFGAIVNDPRSCNFTLPQIATEVTQFTQMVHVAYPNAQVGDIEPIIDGAYPGGVVSAINQWHQAYQTVAQTPFPFFFADIDWSNPAWPSLVKSLEDQSHQSNIAFGILYIGDMTDTSDQQWTSKAAARFQLYQGTNGGQPDFVLFQSWEPYPHLCLPETDPTTFTGLLDTYINATTP
jgi:hypothetical protein